MRSFSSDGGGNLYGLISQESPAQNNFNKSQTTERLKLHENDRQLQQLEAGPCAKWNRGVLQKKEVGAGWRASKQGSCLHTARWARSL